MLMEIDLDKYLMLLGQDTGGFVLKHLGKNVKAVIVKIARKLLSRTLAVIKTEIPYEIGVVS